MLGPSLNFPGSQFLHLWDGIKLESSSNKIFAELGEMMEKATAPTPVLLPGRSHGQKSLVGCSSWGRKESDMTEQLSTAQHMVQTKNVMSKAETLGSDPAF